MGVTPEIISLLTAAFPPRNDEEESDASDFVELGKFLFVSALTSWVVDFSCCCSMQLCATKGNMQKRDRFFVQNIKKKQFYPKSAVCLKVLCNTSLNFLQQEEWIYAKCFIDTFNWGRDRKVYNVEELSTIRVNFLLWQSPSALNLRVPFQQIFENSQKLLNESFRPDFGLWFSLCVVGGLGPSILPLYKVPSANFSRDKDPFMGGGHFTTKIADGIFWRSF